MSRTTEDRARELLARMTVEEKAQQLTAVMPFGLLAVDAPTREQLRATLGEGIGQVSMFPSFGHLEPAELARAVNTVQRYLVEETRLGIPAIFHLEALNGLVAPGFTAFPTAIGLAATWNPGGVSDMARILARQMRAVGHTQALSPVMDVARDPRWGRVHESYGEDPCLAAEFSVAFVRGMQGENLRDGAVATGKHFLGFAVTEGGQHMSATAVGRRELREVYARPFEAAIREAGLASVMNSYSTVDGVPVGADRSILTTLLRDQLGFEGTVVSDYGTIANLHDRQGIAEDLTEAGRMALEAGLDVELPDAKGYGPTLAAAVRKGIVDESLVDRSVLRVLRHKFELGLFDTPYVAEEPVRLAAVAKEGAELARELARQSVTVLRNDGGVLPLARTARRIAVVGPHAESVLVAFPGYTYVGALGMMAAAFAGESVNMAGTEEAQQALPPQAAEAIGAQLAPQLADGLDAYARRHYGAESLVDALRRLVPEVEVVGATGCRVEEREAGGLDAALDAAREADIVVLALGGRPGWFGSGLTEGEGSDRADIDLPAAQIELARAVGALGRPTVGVVFTGRPFALTELDGIVPALVSAPYGGQSGSAAVAEVLLGDVEPSGRLPVSLPRHVGQIPVHSGQHLGSGYRRTDTDAHKGYTDMASRPLYPFGHGLSYTTFGYGDLVAAGEIQADGEITASVAVTNTGGRAGTEVVQFYASHRARGVTRPAQQLIAFARVELVPGESRTVEVRVPTSQLAYLGGDGGETMMFEPGEVELAVGASSDDLRAHARVVAVGPTATWPGDRRLLAEVRVSPAKGVNARV